ncbi:MAG: hypothetical protein HOE11_04290 [Candidatus Diapherotrites archaeon]|nr:hypothetical protein [Candidatus Diapherotrites archaeon]MBT4596859.1 hypothetical protein [Candidatus Diapherotrites archaeon]
MKKKVLGIGVLVLVVCSVFVYAIPQETNQEFQRPENCDGFREMKLQRFSGMDKEAIHEQMIEDLGLSENATREEIRDAMHEKRFSEMREKLDLPNATEEEVREAMREQMGEKSFRNKGFRRGRMGPN